MAKFTFTTPGGEECFGCLALDKDANYCNYFNVFLTDKHSDRAGYHKCKKCLKSDAPIRPVHKIPHCDESSRIDIHNPCRPGDVVITREGFDCGLVKSARNGIPTEIYGGASKYDLETSPHMYGGIATVDWYKTGYHMSLNTWKTFRDEKYYEVREIIRNQCCRKKR